MAISDAIISVVLLIFAGAVAKLWMSVDTSNKDNKLALVKCEENSAKLEAKIDVLEKKIDSLNSNIMESLKEKEAANAAANADNSARMTAMEKDRDQK